MERSEKIGLGVATAGHVLLFGLLSVGFLSTPNPRALEADPQDPVVMGGVGYSNSVAHGAGDDPVGP